MRLSSFGEKFTARSGILELMADLDLASSGERKQYMLGGGNPARIPEVADAVRKRMEELVCGEADFDRMIGAYDSAHGNRLFLQALTELLVSRYGWDITEENIAVTNGSQIAFFYLLNMFAGADRAGRRKKILFPISPEYIGYADQGIDPGTFVSFRPEIRMLDDHTYKYFVDFSRLRITDDIGAICVSRPTNPTGNVITDGEVRRLAALAAEHGIPLIVDNAYGTPFPNIIFNEAEPYWDPNVILSMSLSKLGLPSVRTGIVIADRPVIEAISAMNAIVSLANGGIGQVLLTPMVRSGEILRLSRDVIRPFYEEKSRRAAAHLHESFRGIDHALHACEGSIFLWLWLRNQPIGTMELYRRLKKRDVLVIPGKYFFYGLGEDWDHSDQCIRINYSQAEEAVHTGIGIIADEVRRL